MQISPILRLAKCKRSLATAAAAACSLNWPLADGQRASQKQFEATQCKKTLTRAAPINWAAAASRGAAR